MQHLPNMHWFPRLLIRKEHKEVTLAFDLELRNRVHRLEIALAEQRERLDALEGRHASLSASIRGRLGGRPARPAAASGDPPLPFAYPP